MKNSVVVSTYNGEKFIEKQLETLYIQNSEIFEVIIMDDCSVDRTYEIVQNFIEKNSLINWKLYKNETNCGYIQNFTNGIKKTQGDVIYTCDQDDEWISDKILKMSYIFEEHPEIKLLASSIESIDEYSQTIEKPFVPFGMKDTKEGSLVKISFEKILEKNFFPGCTMGIRKELADRYCSMQNIIVSHDWAMALLAALDDGLYWYNVKMIKYRIHSSNTLGLAAVKNGRVSYIKYMISTWWTYCMDFNKRIEFCDARMNEMPEISQKLINNYHNIKVFNGYRSYIVCGSYTLCESPVVGNSDDGSINNAGHIIASNKFGAYLKEIRAFRQDGPFRNFDIKGLGLDFIYIFKRHTEGN